MTTQQNSQGKEIVKKKKGSPVRDKLLGLRINKIQNVNQYHVIADNKCKKLDTVKIRKGNIGYNVW